MGGVRPEMTAKDVTGELIERVKSNGDTPTFAASRPFTADTTR